MYLLVDKSLPSKLGATHCYFKVKTIGVIGYSVSEHPSKCVQVVKVGGHFEWNFCLGVHICRKGYKVSS